MNAGGLVLKQAQDNSEMVFSAEQAQVVRNMDNAMDG